MFKLTVPALQANPDGAAPPPASASGPAPGAAQSTWFADEYKDFVATKGYRSANDALMNVQSLEKLLGADRAGRTVVLPKDDKDVEGRKAFLEKIGVPKDVAGYKTPDSLKDDPLWQPSIAAALKHGIPASSFDGFMADVLTAASAMAEKTANEAKTASENALTELRGAWGDKFDANAELGRRYVRSLGINDDELAKMESALGTAKFLKMFHAAGTKMGEHEAAGGGSNSGGARLSKDEAKAKLEAAKQQRVEGKLSAEQYQAEFDRLAPMVYAP